MAALFCRFRAFILMWSQERHTRILSLLSERQRLTTEMFAAELGVSKETVRRDLIELEQHGKLNRVHGGAIPSEQNNVSPEASYPERTRLQRSEKQAIARAAAALIESSLSCFIDAGSTTHALAQELAQAAPRSLRVITNSFDVAMCLSARPEIEVHQLGGQLSSEMPATYGEFTIAEIARFHVDLAIISPTALCAQRGAMDYVWHEASVARAMIDHARSCLLLADASKLGASSRVQICAAAAVGTLVTDARADAQALQALREAGIGQIVVA